LIADEYTGLPGDYIERLAHVATFFSPICVYAVDTVVPARDKLLPGYYLWALSLLTYAVLASGMVRLSIRIFAALRMRDR